jgi:hypothetical protein
VRFAPYLEHAVWPGVGVERSFPMPCSLSKLLLVAALLSPMSALAQGGGGGGGAGAHKVTVELPIGCPPPRTCPLRSVANAGTEDRVLARAIAK